MHKVKYKKNGRACGWLFTGVNDKSTVFYVLQFKYLETIDLTVDFKTAFQTLLFNFTNSILKTVNKFGNPKVEPHNFPDNRQDKKLTDFLTN
jgi:hypothetical protein